MCHIVNFEFTRRVQIQNLQHDNCFVVSPTQQIQDLQYDTCIFAIDLS